MSTPNNNQSNIEYDDVYVVEERTMPVNEVENVEDDELNEELTLSLSSSEDSSSLSLLVKALRIDLGWLLKRDQRASRGEICVSETFSVAITSLFYATKIIIISENNKMEAFFCLGLHVNCHLSDD